MFKKTLKLISEHSQIVLIISIFLLIFFSPYYWDKPLANYINFVFLSFILISAILTLKKSSDILKVVKQAGYLLIILTLITAITENTYLEVVNRILFVLFFMLVSINLLMGIVKSREVDSKVIFSAVAVYVLFGFCGAVLAAVITFFDPDAFILTKSYDSQFHQFLYFSYITITTTGYGDILPFKHVARTLAIFLALFGNLYLTVIIGILIGKYLLKKSQT